MPTAQSVNLYRVARDVGIVLRDASDHSPTSIRPRHCFCKPTLRQIGQTHGEEHLRLVLRLIVESAGNAAELHASTIKAVSALLDAEAVTVDGALFDAFDRIDLRTLRLWAQSARGIGKATVADLMAGALLAHLDPLARDIIREAA
jgi:hypothetical protein